MPEYDEATAARVSAAVDRAFGNKPRRRRTHPPKMTHAKAQRVIDALAAVVECEDFDNGHAVDEVRAMMEQYL